MSNAPGPSRPNATTNLLASPRPGASKYRDPSAVRYGSLPSLGRLPARRRRTPHIQFVPFLLASSVFVFVIFIAWDVSTYGNCYFKPLCRILGDGSENLREVWWVNSGPYAPWKPVGPGGGNRGIPRGCQIDQVNVLHRHSARYPTTDGARRILSSLSKLRDREVKQPRRHPELSFLSNVDYAMGDWDLNGLMDQGRKAAWRSGLDYKLRYEKLVNQGEGVFSRSAGGERVVETGQYWLDGFQGNRFRLRPIDVLPTLDVVMPESDSFNNTLAVHNCPAFEESAPTPGSVEMTSILSLLEPTAHKLNHLLRPRPPLEVQDLANLAELCAFQSQAYGTEFSSWSDWCRLFDRDEWDVLGYAKEVGRWYQVGQGSEYGRTMGAGWIKELLARLTESAPDNGPTINSTLDNDPATFPKGGKRLFVDFTHDNEMIEILAAMRILTWELMRQQHASLPIDKVQDKRNFILSEIIPFGAQVVVERIACDLGDWEPDPNPERGRREGKKDYVRILVNDKVHRVDHIDCKQSGLLEHGMCEVELFVSSQSFATDEADWSICREKS